MLQNTKSPLIGSNRKTLKAARQFADCAVEELAWVVAARTGIKLSFDTSSQLREHVMAMALHNMQLLADALIEEHEVGRPPALNGAGSGSTAPEEGAAEPRAVGKTAKNAVSAHAGDDP